MGYSSYTRLYGSTPQTPASLSNTKFLPPAVYPPEIKPIPLPVTVRVQMTAPSPQNPPVPMSPFETTNTIAPSCSASKSCGNNDWKKDPKIWGPHLWYYMHYSAANYPNSPTAHQKHAMKQWLQSLSVTIPCGNCGHHFNQYIRKHQHRMDEICNSRETLFRFLVDIHNKVNQTHGKPAMSYKEAKSIFY